MDKLEPEDDNRYGQRLKIGVNDALAELVPLLS